LSWLLLQSPPPAVVLCPSPPVFGFNPSFSPNLSSLSSSLPGSRVRAPDGPFWYATAPKPPNFSPLGYSTSRSPICCHRFVSGFQFPGFLRPLLWRTTRVALMTPIQTPVSVHQLLPVNFFLRVPPDVFPPTVGLLFLSVEPPAKLPLLLSLSFPPTDYFGCLHADPPRVSLAFSSFSRVDFSCLTFYYGLVAVRPLPRYLERHSR